MGENGKGWWHGGVGLNKINYHHRHVPAGDK